MGAEEIEVNPPHSLSPLLAVPDPLIAEEMVAAARLRAHFDGSSPIKDKNIKPRKWDLPPSFRTDFFLGRWHRAHKGDLHEIERGMEELLMHRVAFGYGGKSPDEWKTISKLEFSSRVFEKFSIANLQIDSSELSDDIIVWVQRMEGVDLPSILRTLPLSHVLHTYFLVQERFHQAMSEQEQRTGRQAAVVILIDLEGLSITDFLNPLSASSQLARLVVKIWSDYFSENLIRLYLLNPPAVVTLLWQIAKHILDARTHSRIVFLNHPKELFRHLRPEAIPQVYGGKRRDTSGFCGDRPETCVSTPARVTPDQYFDEDVWWKQQLAAQHSTKAEGGDEEQKLQSKYTRVTLKSGQLHEVRRECRRGDSLIWMFTVNSDVEFEIVVVGKKEALDTNNNDRCNGNGNNSTNHKTKAHRADASAEGEENKKEAEEEVVWPRITLTSLKTPEYGRIDCTRDGSYSLRFRSAAPSWTHSWWLNSMTMGMMSRGTALRYRVCVVTAGSEKTQ